MASQEPLDEIVWRSQDWALHFGGIHENTVLFYFAKSPFFDPTSNNASVETQAMFNPSMTYILGDRETFERHLRTLQGLEYTVFFGPRDFGGERPIGEGLWVIRKQNRRKRAGDDDQVTVLATYFVVGETIYMAPSLENVIGGRLLSATLALNKLFAKASALSTYTPATGHRYISPNIKVREGPIAAQASQQSKESTPDLELERQAEAAAIAKTSTAAPLPPSNKTTDLATLRDAFMQFNAYGNEYMDENPLLGEPGSFVFSSSKQHLRAQQEAAAKRAQQQAALKAQTEAEKQSRPQSSAPDTPQVKSETAPPTRKGSRGPDGVPKFKRKKSKAPGTPAPASPANATL